MHALREVLAEGEAELDPQVTQIPEPALRYQLSDFHPYFGPEFTSSHRSNGRENEPYDTLNLRNLCMFRLYILSRKLHLVLYNPGCKYLGKGKA